MTTSKPKEGYRFSCLLRAIFLLIGVPSLLLGSIGLIGLYGASVPGNLKANGSIVGIDNGTGDCPTYEVAFTAEDGTHTTFEQEYCFDEEARIGQTVSVLYDPQHPDLYPQIIQITQSARYRVAGYVIAGLVFVLLGLLPLRIKSRRRTSATSAAENPAQQNSEVIDRAS